MKVPVTLRADDAAIPPFEAFGTVPFAESPLAVTAYATWNAMTEQWTEGVQFQVTHRASGFRLGQRTFNTEAEAMGVLERCDPLWPAWVAIGSELTEATLPIVQAALTACRYKFRVACEGQHG